MKWIKSLQGCSSNKGYKQYRTKEARLAFCGTLLKLTDKLFFAPLVPLITLSFTEVEFVGFTIQLLMAFVIFTMALCGRHEALKAIDEIHSRDRS